jgi:hypothetical protein
MLEFQEVTETKFTVQVPCLRKHVSFKQTTTECFLKLGFNTIKAKGNTPGLLNLVQEAVLHLNVNSLLRKPKLSFAFEAQHERVNKAQGYVADVVAVVFSPLNKSLPALK